MSMCPIFDTASWEHARWSPCKIDVYAAHCTAHMLLLVIDDEAHGKVPDSVRKSQVLHELIGPTEGWAEVDFAAFLSRSRALCRSPIASLRMALVAGAPFDTYRLLDLGAALPYENGPVSWKVTQHTTGPCLLLAGESWRCAIMACDPNGLDLSTTPVALPLPAGAP